jgi:hypothetical protein
MFLVSVISGVQALHGMSRTDSRDLARAVQSLSEEQSGVNGETEQVELERAVQSLSISLEVQSLSDQVDAVMKGEEGGIGRGAEGGRDRGEDHSDTAIAGLPRQGQHPSHRWPPQREPEIEHARRGPTTEEPLVSQRSSPESSRDASDSEEATLGRYLGGRPAHSTGTGTWPPSTGGAKPVASPPPGRERSGTRTRLIKRLDALTVNPSPSTRTLHSNPLRLTPYP